MGDGKSAKLLLSRTEAAAAIGGTEYEVGQLIDGGHIRALRVGKNIRVHRASLDAFIAGDIEKARA